MHGARALSARVLPPIEMEFCGIVFWPCDFSGCCSIIAATTEARHGTHADEAGYSVAEGGTQRADSNAPIAQQCQWFLRYLVALSIRMFVRSISARSQGRAAGVQVHARDDPE
jgi:hypothetical protein